MSNQRQRSSSEPLVRFRIQMKLPEHVVNNIRREALDQDKSEARVIARKLKELYGEG